MAPVTDGSAQGLAKLVDDHIKDNAIMVFSKSYCPFGGRVETLLKNQRLPYGLLYLDNMDEGDAIQSALFEKTGQKTVPNVFVSGQHIGGCDDTLGKAQKEPDFFSQAVKSAAKAASSNGDAAAEDGTKYDYDLIVVGGGSGGLAASKEAAKLGLTTACFDYVKPTPVGTTWGLGGTCVNVGCIPKKLMHQAAILGESVVDSEKFGWATDGKKPEHNWGTMVENIQSYIGGLNWGYKVALRSAQVKYFNELVTFKDAHTIKATNPKKGTEKELTAKNFVVAVGGRPKYPDIPGAKELGITSDDIFSLQESPGKTLLVGASYISLECGGFLAGLGLDTTVMVRSILLRGFDQQMAEKIGTYMEEHGIKFVKPCVPTALELVQEKSESGPRQIKVTGKYSDGTPFEDTFNTVVFAIGRDADTSSLGLGEAGVKVNPKNGKIIVNDREQSSSNNVYAIGDVIDGGLELTPVAIQCGKLLARRLADPEAAKATRNEGKMDYINVATTVFTPIEYGACGYSEEDAMDTFGADNIEVFHTNFWPLEWTLAKRPENASYCKLVCNKNDKMRVVGFHYLGPNAGEVTQGYAGMIKMGATKEDFDDLVGIHPTTAENLTLLGLTKSSGADASAAGC